VYIVSDTHSFFFPSKFQADVKESNARFIRWSDNSLSLLVGNELFDVQVLPMLNDHQYLVAAHSKDGIFATQSRLEAAMNFRPHSLSSRTHRKLTAAIADKHRKSNRTKIINVTQDPEKAKLQAEKVMLS